MQNLRIILPLLSKENAFHVKRNDLAYQNNCFYLWYSFASSVSFVLLYLLLSKGALVSSSVPGKPAEVEYKDFVVIILTALSVMVVLGGLVFAFLAVFGHVEAKRFIERKVEKFVEDDLEPMVERTVERRFNQGGFEQSGGDAKIVDAVGGGVGAAPVEDGQL